MKTIVTLFMAVCLFMDVTMRAFTLSVNISANGQIPAKARTPYVIYKDNKVITAVSKVVINTIKIFNIESSSATCNYIFRVETGKSTGNGVCVGKGINPAVDGTTFAGHTDGPDCNVNITGLTPNSTFHVRAYAKTGDGKVWYGNDLSFTTPQKK